MATTQIEWTHPVHGRVSEHACRDHERAVLAALRTLGIGASGKPDEGVHVCGRCAASNQGVHARDYVATRAVC